MLLATKYYFERWGSLNEKASFNPFPANTE